jgi:crotonobetainyl-CoA:carnitine CoA-transferase CaiB-like acyl-CoA transferase
MFREVWSALTGVPEPAARVEITGPPDVLPSIFPVTQLATVSVVSALAAADDDADLTVDTRHVGAAFRSERYLRVDDEPAADPFDPLSAFFRTADGWVRLHANYPWHRERLLGVLGVDNDREAVAAAVARWPGLVLEDAIAGVGGCAAVVRTPAESRSHPQGKLVAALPLLELGRAGDAPARAMGRPPRVLDLTRVIAGPVCTRTLAAHGADVLRIDRPDMPEPEFLSNDALVGKRSAFLDLRDPTDRAQLDALVADADVVVQGYRPGALDAFGLDPDALAARHPGLVVLTLSAWGHDGPWSGRRGFDSLVQAASGIAVLERVSGSETPGALPAQILDHATGYLAAAAVLVALRRQQREGGSWRARLSLSQTASWLLRQPRRAIPTVDEIDPTPYLVDLASGERKVTVVTPPGQINGRPLAWPSPPPTLGADAPQW